MTDDLSMNKQATDERAIFQSLEALFEEIDRKLLLTQRLDLHIKALYSSSRDRNEILFPPRLVTHEHFESFRMKVESKLDKLATDVTQTSSNLAEQKRMLSAVLENQKRLFEILQDIKPTQNQLLTVQPVHAHHQAQHESPARKVHGTDQTPATAQNPVQPNMQTTVMVKIQGTEEPAETSRTEEEQSPKIRTYETQPLTEIITPLLRKIKESMGYKSVADHVRRRVDMLSLEYEKGQKSDTDDIDLRLFVLVLLCKVPNNVDAYNNQETNSESSIFLTKENKLHKHLLEFLLKGTHKQVTPIIEKWDLLADFDNGSRLREAVMKLSFARKKNTSSYGLWINNSLKPATLESIHDQVTTAAKVEDK